VLSEQVECGIGVDAEVLCDLSDMLITEDCPELVR
jgi:hypothetical protein